LANAYKKFFLIFLLQSTPSIVFCGERHTLNGMVRDASTNEPLVYANIVVDGTQLGTTTDVLGKFNIILPEGTYSLRCSYVGYQTVLVPVSVVKDFLLTIHLSAMDVLLQDVTIYAHRHDDADEIETSTLSLRSEKMKNITSITSDVLRSIQMLPGVSANNEMSAKFNVRGGNQDENLVLINGTQVYDPFHLKEVPNASFGIFNMDMISTMDLMTGGFPARYGDRMSSVVNINYREGNREQYKGAASISLTDIGALVEGPVGSNGSFIFGGRTSYFEPMMKLLNVETPIHFSFYDVQGVLGYSVGPRDKVMLKFIHAGDNFLEDPDVYSQTPSQWNFSYHGAYWKRAQWSIDSLIDSRAKYFSTMVALQSIHIFSSSAVLKTEVSFYDQRENEKHLVRVHSTTQYVSADTSYFSHYGRETFYLQALQIRTLEFNSALDIQLLPLYGIKTGFSYQQITYNQNQTYRRTNDVVTNLTADYPDTLHYDFLDNTYDFLDNHIDTRSFKVAGFLENVFQINEHLLLNIGGRFDYFDLNKDLTLSPRVYIAYYIDDGLTLRGAWGYYYQSPIYRQIAYSVACDTNTQSQLAIHYVLGADYSAAINREKQQFIKMKLEGYYKKYNDLITAKQTGNGYVYYSRKNDAVGKAIGMDMFIAYSSPGFSGWVSYGLLSSRQEQIANKDSSFPRNTDQRHTISAVTDIGLGSRWSLGIRMVYGSGYPYTPMIYDRSNSKWIEGQSYSEYLPPYKRVDVRITKEFNLFGNPASVFLDVSNILNFKNIFNYLYRIDDYGNPEKKIMPLWPMIPSIGMSMRF
jgi:outer membrane receptor for ferrienterochelin and colicin